MSLAHHFRRHGYETVSIGKISHEPGGTMPPDYEVHQIPFSWDKAFVPTGHWASPWHAFFAYSNGRAYNAAIKWVRDEPPRLPFENADVGDDAFADHYTAEAGIAELHRLAAGTKPFLLAVGFFKPHLPHNAPQKYWDLFPADRVGMPDNFHPPQNVDPAICIHKSPELTVHYQWPSGPGNIGVDEAVRQRQAYYAAVAYVDAQIGRLVDTLRHMPCYENTVVALWSDHGWQLGEHHMFSKHTNYEVATNSPLILRTPGMPQPGVPADGLVESIDLYPTLTELCQLPTPRGLAGTSLVPAVQQPSAECKDSAYSAAPGGKGHHGHSLRTRDYRLVRWVDKNGTVGMVELYDCRRDSGENVNIAANHPDIVAQLSNQLAGKMAEVVQTSH